MITVRFIKQSNYPVNGRKLKVKLTDFLKKHGIVSDAEVSVVVLSEKKMLELSKKYLKENPPSLHNVLSFTSEEDGGFVYPPEGGLQLGEIAVCYKKVVEEARKEGKLIQDKTEELVLHGAMHLLGIHHQE
jgi:probable rRNA maturation factor